VNENATTSAANVISNEEREKFLKLIEEKDKAMLEQTAKIQEMLTKHENLTKQITELTAEVQQQQKVLCINSTALL
jgi:vacuolar-type H+-ATPase subunit E/Vma4